MTRSQHKVMLPDDVWRETMIRAALENKSASDICEQVLRHYADSSETDRPPIRVRSASGRQRSVYIDRSVWAQLSGLKVTERRSISAILEQQLCLYMEMELLAGR